MQILNNIPAFSVWKNYSFNVSSLRQSMGRLASGMRINSAGDDPAGLAMSERLRAQFRNTAAAASNVENKINYISTADSWLQKIHDILGRMAELAIMANDGTKSQTDRANLQKEFDQMQREVQRITSGATAAAKFNGLYLFRGGNGVAIMTGDGVEEGYGAIRLQIGPDSNMVFNELPYETRWGRDDFPAQVRRFEALLREKQGKLPCGEYLDMRYDADIVCK